MASTGSDCSSLCGIPSSSSVPSSQKQWRRAIPGISFRRNPFLMEKNCVRSGNRPCFRAVFMKEGLAAAAPERKSASRNFNNSNGVTPLNPLEQRGDAMAISGKNDSEPTVSITVVGASGDLAKKKIYPALFALFYEGCLPEGGRVSNRLFYLSIPPNVFIDAVKCASLSASSSNGWTRVIVEKPFGRDSESSAILTRGLKKYLKEDQIFRYFDSYGIIRDIMQNHLLQILALFAMETPVSLDAEDIRNEKVKVLRSMRPLQLDDVVIGQYKSHSKAGVTHPGYLDDKTVPKGSLTPTFAAAALFIDNARWDGVPFLMKAGKALHSRRAEIRVQFRHVPGNLYRKSFGTDMDRATNELVIRVQPDEAIYLKINNKIPGLGMRLDRSNLNLHYAARYSNEIPDAYERLLLDAIEGERRLFIRSDELDAAWALFTPLLKEIEEKKIVPELYPYGSRGPVGAHYLAAKYKVRWGDLSAEHQPE